jgi:hypothetical protein
MRNTNWNIGGFVASYGGAALRSIQPADQFLSNSISSHQIEHQEDTSKYAIPYEN